MPDRERHRQSPVITTAAQSTKARGWSRSKCRMFAAPE
jgi:hypothetical protein